MTGALFDLGGLTKPATVLIERISDAVGGIAKPWQIERVAKAEAKADVERAKARIEITDLERRALERLVREEAIKQNNIESIAYKSIEHLRITANPEDISEDWLAHFFERSRLTSDGQMQILWAKILAGEANAAGSISRRTVDLVSTLEKEDAILLSRLLSWTIVIHSYDSTFNIKSTFDDFQCIVDFSMVDRPFTFNEMCHLEDLGFIKFDPVNGYALVNLPPSMEFRNGVRIGFVTTKASANGEGNQIQTGNAIFTKAGVELAKVFKHESDEIVNEEIFNYWIQRNYAVGSLI